MESVASHRDKRLEASLCTLEAWTALAGFIDCCDDCRPDRGLFVAVQSAAQGTHAVYWRGPYHVELPVTSFDRMHIHIRSSGQLISKPKNELFGVDILGDL